MTNQDVRSGSKVIGKGSSKHIMFSNNETSNSNAPRATASRG